MSSNWSNIDLAATRAVLQVFGEPVVYQPVAAGKANGSPVTITATRNARPREESGAMSNMEEISINPLDLVAFPQRGDWVTAWGSQFVVTNVRQPDPYGPAELVLMARST